MELEEMQSIWSEMSGQLEKQKKLTDKMIIMMTQEKYRNKLNKIAFPETIGAIFCYAIAIFILINISKLDNWYTLFFGILIIVSMLVLPIVSLRSINKMRNLDVAGNNYKETLIQYAKGKKQFQKVVKIGYYLGFILMFAVMPVTSKLLKGKDFFSEVNFGWNMIISVLLAIVFFVLFSRWAIKCYRSNINDAESLLKEINDIL